MTADDVVTMTVCELTRQRVTLMLLSVRPIALAWSGLTVFRARIPETDPLVKRLLDNWGVLSDTDAHLR
jgi:hypothetical protein